MGKQALVKVCGSPFGHHVYPPDIIAK